MKKLFLFLCFVLLTVYYSTAQILPAPGDKLNYTQIMFEHPVVKGANQYLVEVALDSSGASFQHPVASSKDSSTAALISHFEFGKKYVWRYTGIDKGKQIGWKGPYNFEILTSNLVDKKLFHVKVLKNDTAKNAGGLIILDVPRTIVDRNGNCVWFLPPVISKISEHPAALSAAFHQPGASGSNQTPMAPTANAVSTSTNDIRFTHTGTMTLLSAGQAEERNLKGEILWKAPDLSDPDSDDNDNIKHLDYHHCFRKLANGNYMVIATGNAPSPGSVLYKLNESYGYIRRSQKNQSWVRNNKRV